MKQVKFLKEYHHTARRVWAVGDMPHLDGNLADTLIAAGIAELVGEYLPTRGITDQDVEQMLEEEKENKRTRALRKGVKADVIRNRRKAQ